VIGVFTVLLLCLLVVIVAERGMFVVVCVQVRNVLHGFSLHFSVRQ